MNDDPTTSQAESTRKYGTYSLGDALAIPGVWSRDDTCFTNTTVLRANEAHAVVMVTSGNELLANYVRSAVILAANGVNERVVDLVDNWRGRSTMGKILALHAMPDEGAAINHQLEQSIGDDIAEIDEEEVTNSRAVNLRGAVALGRVLYRGHAVIGGFTEHGRWLSGHPRVECAFLEPGEPVRSVRMEGHSASELAHGTLSRPPLGAADQEHGQDRIGRTSGEANHPGPPTAAGKKPAPAKAKQATTPKTAQPRQTSAPAARPAAVAQRMHSAGVTRPAWQSLHAGIGSSNTKLREGHMMRRDLGNKVVYSGTERIATVGPLGTWQPGVSMLVDYPNGIAVNPSFLGARLPLMAHPYAKYEFKKLHVIYQPASTEFNAPLGEFLLGYGADPDAQAPDIGLDGVNAMASWSDNVVRTRACDNVTLQANLGLELAAPLFVETNDQDRFSAQGVIRMVNEGTVTVSGQLGTLYIVYEVEFMEPDLPQAAEPTVFGYNLLGVPSGASGKPLLDALTQWTGSTDVMTTLNPVGSGTPQFLLNAEAPGTAYTAWQVQIESLANTAAATSTFPATVVFTPAITGGFIDSWVTKSYQTSPSFFNLANAGGNMVTAATNTFYFNGAPAPTMTNAPMACQTWRIRSTGPVLLAVTAPLVNTGQVIMRLAVTRVQDDGTTRTRAHSLFLTTTQQRNVDIAMNCALASKPVLVSLINGYVADVNSSKASASPSDTDYLSAFHAAIGTDMPTSHSTAPHMARPAILPLLASAASWLISKFGLGIAAHVVGYGAKKLAEYAAGEDEEPDKRERRRERRDRKRTEEENPEV